MQIFPAIDLRGGQVGRLTQGDYDQMDIYSPDPADIARKFKAAGAKNLHVVDLDGAKDGTLANFDAIRAIVQEGGLFIEVGGGIRDEERIRQYLDLGVGRVILGTVAITNFSFLKEMVAKYKEKIAVGVDAKDGFIAINGWKEITGTKSVDFCKDVYKRQVYGTVDIDMIAGPSEILVLADGSCNPRYVAADLLSQAEHDRLASAVLVTDSPELAKAVQAELEVQIPQLSRADIARESIDTNGKIVLADSMKQAVEISNLIAPEHLEICVDDPFALLNSVKNAGSIFLGKNVPEALGDYFAGPNHTLPTSGTARFSSPLSVDDFVKKSSFIYYTKQALSDVQARVVDFATREGLTAHAKSVSIRFED